MAYTQLFKTEKIIIYNCASKLPKNLGVAQLWSIHFMADIREFMAETYFLSYKLAEGKRELTST